MFVRFSFASGKENFKVSSDITPGQETRFLEFFYFHSLRLFIFEYI